jgi:hypothetical protein
MGEPLMAVLVSVTSHWNTRRSYYGTMGQAGLVSTQKKEQNLRECTLLGEVGINNFYPQPAFQWLGKNQKRMSNSAHTFSTETTAGSLEF